eukprot:scaffold979_cov382-Prasinococcus_capsulatus_cf.AAC.3
MAGGAADCQFWQRNLGIQCRLFELNNKKRITVTAASKLLANTLYGYKGRGLSMGTMVAGWDGNGPGLFYVDSEGTRIKVCQQTRGCARSVPPDLPCLGCDAPGVAASVIGTGAGSALLRRIGLHVRLRRAGSWVQVGPDAGGSLRVGTARHLPRDVQRCRLRRYRQRYAWLKECGRALVGTDGRRCSGTTLGSSTTATTPSRP